MAHLSDLDWPKRTTRLALRPAVEGDFEDLWKVRRQEAVALWMTDLSGDWSEFDARMREPGQLSATLVFELDGVVIGDLMLRPEDAWAQGEVKDRAVGTMAEIGWCIDPAHGGRGYATEAAAELVRIAFEELWLRRVTALCFADNEPSWRLMERLGMRREAHHRRDALHRERGWLDGFAYALLAEEWVGSPR